MFWCFLEQIWGYSSSSILLLLIVFGIVKKDFIVQAFSNFDAYKKSYILSMSVLFLLAGFYIPSNTISSSPMDFFDDGAHPIQLLLHNMSIYMGLFLFWGTLIYYLSEQNIKKVLSFLSILFVGYSLCGLLLVKMPHIVMTKFFNFEVSQVNFNPDTLITWIYYILIVIIPFVILTSFFLKKTYIINKLLMVILLTTFVLSARNFVVISNMISYSEQEESVTSKDQSYIRLSKNGKNVLVIFLDRFVGSLLPRAFEEDKNLYRQFKGFTYYPKTLSYYSHTILGYPPILGGYDYTPLMMDSRPGLFETKFKQSMTVLPAIFAENGWNASIINPIDLSWKKYVKWGMLPDQKVSALSSTALYEKYHINYMETPKVVPSSMMKGDVIYSDNKIENNLFFYSMLPLLPPNQRQFVYNGGNYHSKNNDQYLPTLLIEDYNELASLDKMTAEDSDKDSFVVLNNALSHSTALLSYPNYDLNPVSDTSYKPNLIPDVSPWTLKQYHTCMASLKLLGKYMEFLKRKNLYDNTRIIIVADHGSPVQLRKDSPMLFNLHNPVLLVKDFNKKGLLVTDNTIVSNADVPLIATQGIIHNPTNVYTNRSLKKAKEMDDRSNRGIIVKMGNDWNPLSFIGEETVFSNGMYAYFKGEDPSKKENWIELLKFEKAKQLMENQHPSVVPVLK